MMDLIPDLPPDDGTDETHDARQRAIAAWWRAAVFDQHFSRGRVGRKHWRITWDLYKALVFNLENSLAIAFDLSLRGTGDYFLGIPVEIIYDGPVYFFELTEEA